VDKLGLAVPGFGDPAIRHKELPQLIDYLRATSQCDLADLLADPLDVVELLEARKYLVLFHELRGVKEAPR